MKPSSTTLLAGAALAGLLTGSMAQAATSTSNSGAKPGVMAEKGEKKAGAVEKHECAGKNTCKGKGGCKTGDNGCKGKNSCKGKGGCATDGSKKKE
jgi:hypothetical protein